MTKQKTKQLLKLLQELKTGANDHDRLTSKNINDIDGVITIICEMERHDDNCTCPDCCSIS